MLANWGHKRSNNPTGFTFQKKSVKFFSKYMKGTLIALLLLASIVTSAGNFEIRMNGTFPGAEGQVIRLMQYHDQITYREKEIAVATIDQQGEFELSFNTYQAGYFFFRIDHARMGIFLEPGKIYHLEFEPVDFSSLDDSRNPYLDPWYFSFDVIKPVPSLDYHIEKLEDVFHDFLMNNFAAIHRSRNRKALEDFRLLTDSLFGDVENEYFQDYYRYKFAYYYRVANLDNFENMTRKYILNQPVLYHNTQYMNFFNTVFDTYIFAGSRQISKHELEHTVNRVGNYHALMDTLGKDTVLRNEVIRELVMLKALKDMHGDPDYRRSNVEQILAYASQYSKFPPHRNLASNILHQKKYLKQRSEAPAIVLKDADNQEVKIPDDFQGKYVYLGFWAAWCETCLRDFVALDEIYPEFKNDFTFIQVSTDRHKSIYDAFIENQQYPWKNLHFDGNFKLLDAYRVRNLPTYVLIDRQGKIISYPARGPGENLVTFFRWLLFEEERRNRGQ